MGIISQRIKQEMERQNIDAQSLARKSTININTILKYLDGADPQRVKLKQIAKALGVSMKSLKEGGETTITSQEYIDNAVHPTPPPTVTEPIIPPTVVTMSPDSISSQHLPIPTVDHLKIKQEFLAFCQTNGYTFERPLLILWLAKEHSEVSGDDIDFIMNAQKGVKPEQPRKRVIGDTEKVNESLRRVIQIKKD